MKLRQYHKTFTYQTNIKRSWKNFFRMLFGISYYETFDVFWSKDSFVAEKKEERKL